MVARRLIYALLFALAISGLFTFWLSKRIGKPQTAEAATHKYVAAAQNLDPGTLLSPQSLKMVDWPSTFPLEGSFVKPEDLAGRTLLYPVAAGQPILDRQLSQAGAGVGLSAKIPDGMRAISLRSDEVVGVAGFLLPGTHVDVLVTLRPANGVSGDTTTAIVLQDVQVLTAGQKMQPDPDGKATTASVVTLLVTPADAEKVMQATALGSLHFVLRNGSDRQQVTDTASKLGAFGSSPSAPASAAPVATRKNVPAPQPKAYVVQTLRGDKVTEEKF